MLKRRSGLFGCALLLVSSLLMAILPALPIHAANTCTWTGKTAMTCNGTNVGPGTISGANMTFQYSVSGSGVGNACRDFITVNNYKKATSVSILEGVGIIMNSRLASTATNNGIQLAANNTCLSGGTYNLTNTWGGGGTQGGGSCNPPTFNINSNNTITLAKGPCAGISNTFNEAGQSNYYVGSINKDGCPNDYVYFDPVANSITYYQVANITGQGSQGGFTNPLPADLGNYPGTCAANNGAVATIGQNQVGGQQQQQVCETQGGFMADILCGLINALNKVIQWLYSNVLTRLQFQLLEPVAASEDGLTGLSGASYNSVHASWLVVVRLASTLMILVFLIMIIGQAAGNYIDAYTAKKLLPRIVIAFILINLSWYIAGFAMEFSNIVGDGAKAVMLAPFSSQAALIISPTAGAEQLGILLAATVTATLLVIAGPGLFVLVPIVAGILIAAAIGFFLVILRQGFLIACTVFAPVAIVLWVLPGTKSWFNKYRDLFVGLLIMYPLFQIVIAVGALLAYVITAGNS
ncbi:MAG TPA: hypothetical protein VGS28_01750 [Candidatus Saccharimonadales bacterium]|nr:hypothetical protein [Candidatus Saccharimonadales bacterium]